MEQAEQRQLQQLNQSQQFYFAQRLNQELQKVTMSWTPKMRAWHQTALFALKFASAPELQIAQERYIELFNTEPQGLNMVIFSFLTNAVENRTPEQMGVTPQDWARTLIVNRELVNQWNDLKTPFEKKILKEIELMGTRPRIVT